MSAESDLLLDLISDTDPYPSDEQVFVADGDLDVALPSTTTTTTTEIKEDEHSLLQSNQTPHEDESDRNHSFVTTTDCQSPELTKLSESNDSAILFDDIMPSHTVETQDSDGHHHTVEGSYDEEGGQEIVYKKEMLLHGPEGRRRHCLFCSVISVLVIIIILGCVLGTRLAVAGNESGQSKAEDGSTLPSNSTNQTTSEENPSLDGNGTNQSSPFSNPIFTPSNVELEELLLEISGTRLSEEGSPQQKAASIIFNEIGKDQFDHDKITQRYVMLTLLASLLQQDHGSLVNTTECSWSFAKCDSNGTITELAMAHMELMGEIPPEISHVRELTKIDFASNNIQGHLPDQFFSLTKLQHIFLDNNKFSGMLHPSISNMTALHSLYLGNNHFTGTIPGTLPDTLRYISFYMNNFSGPMPDLFLKPNNRFYVDLAYNALSGSLPWNAASSSLRHLYLSHNQFNGQIPRAYAFMRLETLFLDHNQFTGTIPTGFRGDYLSTLQIQGNKFSEGALDESICSLDVFEDGALIDLVADCSICVCDGRLCEKCIQS